MCMLVTMVYKRVYAKKMYVYEEVNWSSLLPHNKSYKIRLSCRLHPQTSSTLWQCVHEPLAPSTLLGSCCHTCHIQLPRPEIRISSSLLPCVYILFFRRDDEPLIGKVCNCNICVLTRDYIVVTMILLSLCKVLWHQFSKIWQLVTVHFIHPSLFCRWLSGTEV